MAGPASQVPEREQRALYMLGVSLARQYANLHLTVEELQYVKAGMREQLLEDRRATGLRLDTRGIDELRSRRASEHAAVEKQKAQLFLEQAAREEGMVKTESGLLFRSLAEGTGPSPSTADQVKVHYRGVRMDGTEFNNSYKKGQPLQVSPGKTLPCIAEGVQRLKVGGKARLVCPSELAFHEMGLGQLVPPGAAVVFELELLEIVRES